MKLRITLLSVLAGLFALNANAQDTAPATPPPATKPGGSDKPATGDKPAPGAPGGPGGAGRGRFQPSAEDIKKYDKDGNGELSREEMRAMFDDRRKEMEKKYDANGDGKLDDEERKKMEAENPRRGPGGAGGAGGPGGPGAGGGGRGAQPTPEEIKTYDKNGDGKLDGDEVTALREGRQKAMLEKYDTDKDGKLSDTERQKMFEDFRKARAADGTGRPPRPTPRPGGTEPKEGENKTEAKKIPTPGTAPAPESK